MGSETMPPGLHERIEINPKRQLARGDDSVYVSMQDLDEHRRTVPSYGRREFKGSGSRFSNGDTLLARITPCLENGKTAYVDFLEEGEVAHGSTEFIVLSGKTGISDPVFVYYLARSPEFRSFAIKRMEGSSGRQRVPATTLKRFTYNLPSLITQRAIAHVLGSLDDKIELNRQMNRTLEKMAQAIFKSWFIDFDPVRAKAEGRDTGLPKEISDLFPDSFEDSELGEIPKGWEALTVDAGFDVTMGQSPPGSTYNENGDGLPFFQGRRDFGFRYPTKRVYCTEPKRLANVGDTLISVRAPVGDINMAYEHCCVGRGVAAVRHKSGSRSFTYYSMRALGERFSRFEGEGTVFGSINKKQFNTLPYIAPLAEIIEAFENKVSQLDENVRINTEEIRTLSRTRDTLLPKLISGELPIPDVEKILEGVE